MTNRLLPSDHEIEQLCNMIDYLLTVIVNELPPPPPGRLPDDGEKASAVYLANNLEEGRKLVAAVRAKLASAPADVATNFRRLATRLELRDAAPSLEGYCLADGLRAAADLLEGKPGPEVAPDMGTPEERIPLGAFLPGKTIAIEPREGDLVRVEGKNGFWSVWSVLSSKRVMIEDIPGCAIGPCNAIEVVRKSAIEKVPQ